MTIIFTEEIKMNIVLLGPPGAGKGTVAALLKTALAVPHISTGDIFRSNIKNGTELGKKVEGILASGGLVPDDVTISMVKNRLQEPDTAGGYILDGFPRTLGQADALSGFAKIDAVLNFVLADEEIIRRLSGRRLCKSTGRIYHITSNPPKVEGIDDETGEPLIQRDDDKPEAIKHRLEVYAESTEPLIAYYKEKGTLIDIDSSPSPETVLASILAALGK